MDDDQDQYFASYENLDVHKLMLEDEPRLTAYRNAILGNMDYFRDKIVMDVGCGTGILSIFCAQAGARKVYAVEASSLANLAKEVVKENKFQHVIEVIHGKVEDIVLPQEMSVDAIVSEWMGFFLLHEGMLDSVLYARDKFLKVGGEMFPESATIYVAPCSLPSLFNNWENVHGVSMKCFGTALRENRDFQPEIMEIKPEHLMGEEVAVCWVNMREDEAHHLDVFNVRHVVGASKNGYYQGLCLWFECHFPKFPDSPGDSRVVLDTSPKSAPTHWKQTVIVLPVQQEVEEGEPIAFDLAMIRDTHKNNRRYDIQLTMLEPEDVEHPLPCSCHLTTCIVTKAYLMQQAGQALIVNNLVLQEEPIDDDDDDGDDDDNDDG